MAFPMQLAKHLKEHAHKMREYLTEDYRDLDPETRKRMASEARNLSAAAAAAIAPMPIPFADVWTITPIQILMVRAIGNIYGQGLDAKTARALFGSIAGGWLGRQTFLGLLKLGLPCAGEICGAAFAYVWTQGMGKAAEAYFASGGRRPRMTGRKPPIVPLP